jgi:hypothetical protein
VYWLKTSSRKASWYVANRRAKKASVLAESYSELAARPFLQLKGLKYSSNDSGADTLAEELNYYKAKDAELVYRELALKMLNRNQY